MADFVQPQKPIQPTSPSAGHPIVDYSVAYRSSRQPELTLYADVYLPPDPAHVLLTFHNWHGDHTMMRSWASLLADEYLVVNVGMRGRGGAAGKPDVNGWELLDAIDAVQYVRRAYSSHIKRPDIAFCLGSGGGGGNVLAAIAKFPGFFAAGVALCGVSDYALWYKTNISGEFRDEMLSWIGHEPDDDLSAYHARSGLHLLENVHAPVLVIHGDEDSQIPVAMSRLYQRRAEDLGKPVEYLEVPYAGHQLKPERFLAKIKQFFARHAKPAHIPDTGVWRIGGYLQTPHDRIELGSIDEMATYRYQLATNGHLMDLEHIESMSADATDKPKVIKLPAD